MIGPGTLLNIVGIIVGGLLGFFLGSRIPSHTQEMITRANGLGVMFIGLTGALKELLVINGQALGSSKSILIIISLSLGALIGETLNIEGKFEQLGEWLKVKTRNAKDPQFVDGFVTATLTVCVGALGIVGSLQYGFSGDSSLLITKAVLDFFLLFAMSCSLGKGCLFAAIPLFFIQGALGLFAKLLQPLLTATALSALGAVGSITVFSVGVNFLFGKKVRVANLLPSLLLAVLLSGLPL